MILALQIINLSVALLNEPDKKIVITAVHENSDIEFLKSTNSFTVQVIEGVLVFRDRKESVRLNPGMMLTVREKTPFHIKAMEKALFLLTIECRKGKANADYN